MNEDHKIAATNLGPIPEIEFFLQSPGVTVLVAPNGSGKTILLDAVQAAARGEGKLPLRDRTRKGKVEAFGATITIGGTCRHTGSFEVTNLEGKFDLAQLVDPRLKSPAAADKARIKALVSLTSVEASVNLFRMHEAFDDFDTVVPNTALATDDLIEMAAKVKACYDEEALKAERRAEREFGQATALIPGSDIDLDAESDQEVLQEAYNEARDEVTRLAEQARNAEIASKKVAEAKDLLEQLGDDELRKERDKLISQIEAAGGALDLKKELLQKLHEQIAVLNSEIKEVQSVLVNSQARIASINRELVLVDGAKKVLADSTLVEAPDEDDIADAKADLALAAAAIEQGVKIRAAKENAKLVSKHRSAGKELQDKSVRYRDAGKSTDEVLSGCIKCPQLRVESDGKSARLVTDTTERGKSIPYHDLSDGERWKIAIDIGADQVGEGGLLVISQIGWEGIDGANRIAIHEHAVERQVYILTAEAASDPNATREIIPTPMGVSDSPPAPKKAEPAKEAKPPEPPKAKAKPKPAPEPEPMDDDEGDIPF